MLTELRVRNLAVIADVTLSLGPGLNVLSGETGAGKSILVGALSLLLGERASTQLVRPGADKAVVEVAFDVEGAVGTAEAGKAEVFLRDADACGVEIEDGRFVVRREINAEGRNRVWVNGSPTTVGVLASLGRRLVDLHGQHESQSLLGQSTQRDILDAFGGAEPERHEVRELFDEAQRLRAEEARLAKQRDDVRKRADYLRHVVREIQDVAPESGEDEALTTELKRLTHAEDLTRLAEEFAELMDGEASGITALLADGGRTLDHLERIDPGGSRFRELLEAATADVTELARDVREYGSQVEIDPGRLVEVEARRDRIYRLLQKYGSTVEEVLATEEQSRRELDLLDTADLDLAEIAGRADAAEERLAEVAGRLSAKRAKAVARLAEAVDGLLPALGLPEGKLIPALTPLDAIGSTGRDQITFHVRLNRGLDPRPLTQVASGGELSRIMLALKVVLARHDAVQTLVFDEVDQGIGGETGAQVGDALAAVAQTRQVLVITHLPQIAARADHHLRVTKGVRGGIATTEVERLAGADRVAEVARMLGDAEDGALRQHAKELLAVS